MSEGIGGTGTIHKSTRHAHHGQHAQQGQLLHTSAASGSAAPPAQLDSGLGSGSGVLGSGEADQDILKQYQLSGVNGYLQSYCSKLAKSLTSDNLTQTLKEIDLLANTSTDANTNTKTNSDIGRSAQAYFLSTLLSEFIQHANGTLANSTSTSASGNRNRAAKFSALELFLTNLSHQTDFCSVICSALYIATDTNSNTDTATTTTTSSSDSDTLGANDNLSSLLQYLTLGIGSGPGSSSSRYLSNLGVIIFTTAICTGWQICIPFTNSSDTNTNTDTDHSNSSSSHQVIDLAARILLGSLEKQLSLNSTQDSIANEFGYVIESDEEESKNSGLSNLSTALRTSIQFAFISSEVFQNEYSPARKIVQALQNQQNNSTSTTTTTTNTNTSTFTSTSTLSNMAERLSPSSGSGITNLLSEVGPGCTSNLHTLRTTLAQFTNPQGNANSNNNNNRRGNNAGGSGGGGKILMTETLMAHLLHFFSEKGTRKKDDSTNSSSGINPHQQFGSKRPDWNLNTVADLLHEFSHLKWNHVARCLDFEGMRLLDSLHFRALLHLYECGAKTPFPYKVMVTGPGSGSGSGIHTNSSSSSPIVWNNPEGQLSLIAHAFGVSSNVFTFPLSEEEQLDAGVYQETNTHGHPGAGTNPKCLNPRGWASWDAIQALLEINDANIKAGAGNSKGQSQALTQQIHETFLAGLLTCPEIMLCAFIRTYVNPNLQQFSRKDVGGQFRSDIMRELMQLFFKPNINAASAGGGGGGNSNTSVSPAKIKAAMNRLWKISAKSVVATCEESWKGSSPAGVSENPQMKRAVMEHILKIMVCLPKPEGSPHVNSGALETCLELTKASDFHIALAMIANDHDLYPLKNFLDSKMKKKNTAAGGANGPQVEEQFLLHLFTFIGRYYQLATDDNANNNNNNNNNNANSKDNNKTQQTPPKSLLSFKSLAMTLAYFKSLDAQTLAQKITWNAGPGSDGNASANSGTQVQVEKMVESISNRCYATHPTLAAEVKRIHPDDIEEMANGYFQKIYTSEQSIDDVVNMLKRFKSSANSRENDIYACMIHNLFDEYRFFSKYPEKELRITGILFGRLIQHQLVSSITLGIALRYVLEALRKPPVLNASSGSSTSGSGSVQTNSGGKMFRFGMFALEQFKERLHEWPQYCSHIVQIPHLKEGYQALVNEIEGAMVNNPPAPAQQQQQSAQNQNQPVRSDASLASTGGNSVASSAGQSQSNHTHTPVPGPGAGSSFPNSSASVGGVGVPSTLTLQFPTEPQQQQQQQNQQPVSSVPVPLPLPIPQPAPPIREAKFGPRLGRAVTNMEGDIQHDPPADTVLDRVQFLINNVTITNVESKAGDLKELLQEEYFGWLGHYLVVKRISTQPNFHATYLAFLECLGDYGKGLIDAILASVYLNVGKLLRSPKITTSTSERSLLKNLGSWLGQITLARNKPILQITLDAKELLYQGYETGMLIAVTPFVAKILEGAKNSIVFRPPNPWLMGLLSVFRSLYEVEDLKMNIKFEVEVLCKNLGVKLEDIPLRTEDLARRIPPMKSGNPDFNTKTAASNAGSATPGGGGMGMQQQPGSVGGGSLAPPTPNDKFAVPNVKIGGPTSSPNAGAAGGKDQQTVIPNLASYVSINPTLTQMFQQLAASNASAAAANEAGAGNAGGGGPPLPLPLAIGNLDHTTLKRSVPIAVDRAIREIIQPVVERSVTIACITTKEIVTKDFAMEGDETKMRKAAQLMVANLAGSLALVTCREPLRASVSNHLRQLLVAAASATTEGAGGAAAASSLSDTVQNVVDQCVSICSQDNLELGCMLIEKAATEKAVRDIDESLSGALTTRKRHKEMTGKPYYDMSIFGTGTGGTGGGSGSGSTGGGQRYPSALPEPLRPKPGGLRNEQLLVYEAFQRIPRQPSTQVAGTGAPGSVGSGSASTSPANVGGIGGINGIGGAGSGAGAGSKSGGVPGVRFNVEALSGIALKLENSVISLLSAAGPRAPEITLGRIPSEHDIKQLLVASRNMTTSVASCGPLTSQENDSALGFAQTIFKRLYELRLSEPLRLEAFVALLESLNICCRQLGKDLGTWATYAPTETDAQRKLHRTVLLLLLRSQLLQVSDLDHYLCDRVNTGAVIWLEFTVAFVRTAGHEKIVDPNDLVKTMQTLSKLSKGGGQSSVIAQLLRSIEEMRMANANAKSAEQEQNQQQQGQGQGQGQQLSAIKPVSANVNASSNNVSVPSGSDERAFKPTHQESSSISATSLSNLAQATQRAYESIHAISRDDPPNLKQQVMLLLDGWMRLSSDVNGSEKMPQYVQLLQSNGIGKNEEQSERFFRVSTEILVTAVLKNATLDENNQTVLNYTVIDGYGKLILVLMKHLNSGGSAEEVAKQRISLLNQILGVTMRTMMAHYEQRRTQTGTEADGVSAWDQRPWFRLLLNLVMDLNSPSPIFDPISYGILSVFGSAFHVVQPLVVPGFAFAWLELISHRMFLSNLLSLKGQKGWALAHQLLMDLFLFLEPHLRKIDLTDSMRQLYKGTMRVLLVLLHDYPAFLAAYHLSFCNVIPENCVQLRNLVLSAFPRGMVLPDPFTPNLKIDLLPDIAKSPLVLSNVIGPITSIREQLDDYLKNRQSAEFIASLLPRLYKDGTKEVDSAKVNGLVLYAGMNAIGKQQSSHISQSLARTAEMDILQKLMDFDDRGRYIALNAIANQLRFPSSHSHYFSCVMLFLFSEAKDEGVREQVTRVLLERLIVHRPHPWGLLITFIELIKNQRYQFWSHPFTRCATEIEKVFESVARSCLTPGGASQKATSVGGSDAP